MDAEFEEEYFDVPDAFDMDDYPSFRQVAALVTDATLGPNIIDELARNPRTASFLGEETYMNFLDAFQENPARVLCSDMMTDPRVKTTLSVLFDVEETAIEQILNVESSKPNEPTQIIDDVKPTVSEPEKFAQGNVILEEECVAINTGDHNFTPSDTLEVIESELVLLEDKIIAIDGNKTKMLPNHEDIKIIDDVKPTVSEPEKFAQGNVMLEEECVAINTGDHNFTSSDTAEVIESELVLLEDKIIAIDGNKTKMLPNHEDIKIIDDVKPTVSEPEKFAQGNVMLEEECVAINTGDHNFTSNDTAEVIESELVLLEDKIIAIDGNKTKMLPNHEDIKILQIDEHEMNMMDMRDSEKKVKASPVDDISEDFEMQVKKLKKIAKEVSQERKNYENAQQNLDIDFLEISYKLKDLKENYDAMNAEMCRSLKTINDNNESISHIIEKNFVELKTATDEIFQELTLAAEWYRSSQMKISVMKEKLLELKKRMEEMEREQSQFEKKVKEELQKLNEVTTNVIQKKATYLCCIM